MRNANTKERLVEAATELMLTKGYTATSVDDVCKAAGLTKGSFFHYFEGKEELGRHLAQAFNEMATREFLPHLEGIADPLDRVYAYVELRIHVARTPGGLRCMLGTFVQELFSTHPALREVCARCLDEHTALIERDLAAAKALYAPDAAWSPLSLARHLMAILQGGMILAKADGDPEVLVDSLEHFKAYLKTLISK